MNNQNPKVTVRVPAYNHEKYIEQTVLSIINQTYQNFELIVIDDGSRDSTPEILQRLSEEYGFTFVRQKNQGVTRTLNRMIGMAKGEYITGCGSDDYWPLDRLEKQVAYMEGHPEYYLCYGRAYNVYNDYIVEGERLRQAPQGKVFDELLKNCFIPAPSHIVRASVFVDVGLYDVDSYIDDWDMWLRIADRYKIGYIDDFLVYYRKHDNNLSSNFEKMERAKLKIIQKWRHKDIFPEALTIWRLSYYCGLLRANRLKDSLGMLRHIRSFIFRRRFWVCNVRFFCCLLRLK